jgi:O-antigen/teichoic acid export membrane protein
VAGLAVALAGYGWGVWSLVAADLAAAGLFAALVWRRAWSRIPLRVEARLIPELLTRSHLLFLIWVTFQCVTYVDAFIVASFADAATVGQYARAYMLAFLMRQIVFPRALLPALVEVRHDPPRFAAAFRLATVFLLFFEVTAGYLLFFNAEMVVAVVLGRQWGPAVALLRILCFVPFLDAFSELGGEVLKVRHEDRLWLAIMLVNLASLVAFGVLFTRRWGAAGMAAANLLLLGNLGMAWRMSRIFAGGFARLLGDMALIYLVPLPLFLAAAVALPAPGWPRLAASVAAALAGGGVLALRFRRPLLDFLQSQARSGHDPVGEASPGA